MSQPTKAPRCDRCAYRHDGGPNALQCRRYAPRPTMADAGACWPRVNPGDWCGDFAAGEAGDFTRKPA